MFWRFPKRALPWIVHNYPHMFDHSLDIRSRTFVRSSCFFSSSRTQPLILQIINPAKYISFVIVPLAKEQHHNRKSEYWTEKYGKFAGIFTPNHRIHTFTISALAPFCTPNGTNYWTTGVWHGQKWECKYDVMPNCICNLPQSILLFN